MVRSRIEKESATETIFYYDTYGGTGGEEEEEEATAPIAIDEAEETDGTRSHKMLHRSRRMHAVCPFSF